MSATTTTPITTAAVSSSPKRSWRRFSLRTLLLAVFTAGSFLGWFTHHARILQKEAAFVDHLRARGFRVYVDPPKFAWFWRALVGDSVGILHRASLLGGDKFGNWIGPSVDEVHRIAEFRSVTALTIYGPGATDESVEAICKLPNLEFLRLINPHITEAGINRARRRLGSEFRMDTP